jgi:hypothetical protein
MIRAETFLTASEGDIRVWDDLVNNSPTPDTYFRPGYAAAYTDESTSAFAGYLRSRLQPELKTMTPLHPTAMEEYCRWKPGTSQAKRPRN